MALSHPTFLLLLALSLAALAAVVVNADGEEAAAAPAPAADDDNDSDSDSDEENCGVDLEDAQGDGPSLEDHGILALAEAAADPRNLVLGWRQYGDCLLYERTFRRAKGFGRLHDVDVTVSTGNATITHVLAQPAGDGGGALRAERKSGGVGHNWLHVKLRAPRSHGLHYEVRVYGARP